MTSAEIRETLQINLPIFSSLFQCFDDQNCHWKLNDQSWCALEIVCHLVDEEKEDFRHRAKEQQQTPGAIPTPIDPVNWVKDRKYLEQDFRQKVNEFVDERKKSLEWLDTLHVIESTKGYQSETFGLVTSSFFLQNWLAHDLLHIKQLTRLRYDYLQKHASVDVAYAGKWT